MRKLISSVDIKNKMFFCTFGNHKVAFYLTNRHAKIFLEYLSEGILVDFEASDFTKKIGKYQAYQVSHFNEIINIKNKKAIYNHRQLKKEMIDFLEDKEYFLFLDLEMTIPFFKQRNFKPELVQYGYVLINKKGETILEDEAYLTPVLQNPISKRTLKFISITAEKFYSVSRPYDIFYNKLNDILETYNPKIVVWGSNDIIALNHSYKVHNLKELTNKNDFIDLLKLHKDYFNLKNDLGLFKAYQTYYDKEELKQIHNAKEDAIVTKKVFEAFVEYSTYDLKTKK